MADTQAELDDELRIAARRVLRAARARPTRKKRKPGLWWGVLLLAIAAAIAGFVLFAQRL